MTRPCITCDYQHKEKFCPNCGEKAGTERISFSSMIEEAVSTITNMDKGFLYNIKNLTINPRKTIYSYLNGKRSNIFNPLSFFLVSITLYLITQSVLPVLNPINEGADSYNSEQYDLGYATGRTTGKFIYKYFDYFWGLSVIWLSMATKLLYRQFNFAEHLTINSFIIGQATLVGILTYPIYQLPIMVDPLAYLIILVMLILVYLRTDETPVILTKSFFALLIFFLLILAVTLSIGKILVMYEIAI